MWGNYGGNMGGGMYGGQGRGGGMEMMMIVICCICCLSLSSIFAGYWFDMFCGISPSLGRKCKKDEDEEEDTNPSPPYTGVPTPYVETCNSARAKVVRSARDPRPELQAYACTGATKVQGRDCFYWRVEPDPVTRLARWVRETDTDSADFKDGSCMNEKVRCSANRIDFSKLPEYTDMKPDSLINLCTPVNPTADTRGTTVQEVSAAATRVGVTNDASAGWNSQDSMVWYDTVAQKVGQRPLFNIITNTANAAVKVKNKLGKQRMSKWLFASMLEAALYSKDSNIDFIGDLTRSWVDTPTTKLSTETSFMAYLVSSVYPKNMTNWKTLIDNPSLMRY